MEVKSLPLDLQFALYAIESRTAQQRTWDKVCGVEARGGRCVGWRRGEVGVWCGGEGRWEKRHQVKACVCR